MPYLGNTAGNRFVASKAATQFSGDGSNTSFTLEHSVGSDEDILVSVDGVIQEPSVAYAVSNGTTLTFTAAPSNNSGNNIFVYYLFRTVATVDHPSTSSLQATDGTFTGDLTVDTDTLKVDTTNDLVGINTATPSDYYSDELVVTAADEGGITIVNSTTHRGYLNFADGTSGDARYRGYISYDHNTDDLYLGSGGSGHIHVGSTGTVLMPNQPAFQAYSGSTQTNVAVGSQVTVEMNTEIFDQNSDFDTSNYTFTAPVTGKYFFHSAVYLQQVPTNASYISFRIATSNRNYVVIMDPNFDSNLSYHSLQVTILADMDASDTAKVRFLQVGGTQQVDLQGNAEYTYFCGNLVC